MVSKNCDTHCSICGGDFASREEYIQHKKDGKCSSLPGEPVPSTSTRVLIPRPVPTVVPAVTEVHKEKTKRSASGICSGCNLYIVNLPRHLDRCPGYPYAEPVTGGYRCLKCGRVSPDLHGILHHFNAVHLGTEKDKEAPKAASKGKPKETPATFPCTHPGCDRVLKTEAARISHEFTHLRAMDRAEAKQKAPPMTTTGPSVNEPPAQDNVTLIRELAKMGYSFELGNGTVIAKPTKAVAQ